jgi:hypothetical protein
MRLRLLVMLLATCAVSLVGPTSSAADKATGTGLSKTEATAIANRFFAEHIAIEAVVGEPTLQGDNWMFPLKVGYAKKPAKDPIVVNRLTGQVSWAGLDSLNAMRRGSKAQSK